MDVRFHNDRSNAGICFATNDFMEARNVAGEVAFHCVVVRSTERVEGYELVYDVAFNIDLPLAP